MVVRTINNVFPDFSGNININMTGTLYDANGLVDKTIKIWTGNTVTGNGDGTWSIDYASANFNTVLSIQVTLESTITVNADKPLGTYVINKSLTSANGKAYKVSSAGLLAAMQQIVCENGVIVNVMVIGY